MSHPGSLQTFENELRKCPQAVSLEWKEIVKSRIYLSSSLSMCILLWTLFWGLYINVMGYIWNT